MSFCIHSVLVLFALAVLDLSFDVFAGAAGVNVMIQDALRSMNDGRRSSNSASPTAQTPTTVDVLVSEPPSTRLI